MPRSGRVIIPAQDPALERVIARGCWSALQRVGEAAGWHTRANGAQSFEVADGTTPLGEVRWNLTGEHNRNNALAALAAAAHAGVSPGDGIAALSQFAGVKRRMEIRGTVNQVTVYDDFAHHPTAIRTTLDGLRLQVGSARILAVLEPRSNTMKLGTMAARLPEALTNADLVFCFGQHTGKHALGWDPAVVLSELGSRMQAHDQLDQLVTAIVGAARPGDHILVMSNGSFGGLHTQLLDALGATQH